MGGACQRPFNRTARAKGDINAAGRSAGAEGETVVEQLSSYHLMLVLLVAILGFTMVLRSGLLALAAKRSAISRREAVEMREQMVRVEQRMAVLERLAIEQDHSLAKEIEQLRIPPSQ